MTGPWVRVGSIEQLKKDIQNLGGLKEILLEEKRIVFSLIDDQFGAISARCNHMGGPLAKGKIKNGHIECPWHYWQFHHQNGKAKNSEASENLAKCGGALPSYDLKVESDSLWINLESETERTRPDYNHDAEFAKLSREPKRLPGKIRVVGISTTAMDRQHPRYSTSEHLLRMALSRGEKELDIEIQFLSLSHLSFRNCEGFYSKSEKACTWPCSITKMDPEDEMIKIYEALVHWSDIVIVATPIRWGAASSLYYKMAERLNSIQNQITMRDRVLIQNKVASFIITGGQDNIQAVSGQMLSFFGELGFISPPFPFLGHSLGWTAEDMEHNMDFVQQNTALHDHAFSLLERSVNLSHKLINASLS